MAVNGLTGIRAATSEGTRIRLEATVLLSICYLKKNEIDKAKPLIKEVMGDETTISSVFQRREFRRRVLQRLEEEVAMASMKDFGSDELIGEDIEAEAGKRLVQLSEDDIFLKLGEITPDRAINALQDLSQFALAELPRAEVKYLPSPESRTERRAVGKTIFSSFKRQLWRALCDPNSEVNKALVQHGLGFVLNKKFIGGVVATTLLGMDVGSKGIALCVTALVIRFGLDVFCEAYKPEGIMEAREKRARSKGKRKT